MTDEFLSLGLEEDRYLKAIELLNQFEEEIAAILRKFDQQMVRQHPEMFNSGHDPTVKNSRTPSSTLANHRINHPMNGPAAPDGDDTRKLNVHLYWVPPTEYDRTDVDSALRAFGYKIKYADPDIDTEVADETRSGDWPIKTSGNPYDSNTVFYNHVSSQGEIDETVDVLVDHFAEFGDFYSSG